jgi:hypothetical protein
MVLTNYAECSGTTTLGTNQTLSKDSLLDRGCMCFIYFTVCSIPTTLSRNETFVQRKHVSSVFIWTLGTDSSIRVFEHQHLVHNGHSIHI